MADDNKFNDDYQFADLDVISPDADNYDQHSEEKVQQSSEKPRNYSIFGKMTPVMRNSLIAAVVFVVFLITYPFIKSAMTTKKQNVVVPTLPTVDAVPQAVPSLPVKPVLIQEPDVTSQDKLNEKLTQQLSTLAMSQQTIRADVDSTNNQLNSMNSNLSNMAAKITELNEMIAQFSAKVEQQSHVIEQLNAHATTMKKMQVTHRPARKAQVPPPTYYLQAIIPGRAWLISSNGTTLTVREGTIIAGLGVVRYIDARQGRVVINSGRIIRFSQEDS